MARGKGRAGNPEIYAVPERGTSPAHSTFARTATVGESEARMRLRLLRAGDIPRSGGKCQTPIATGGGTYCVLRIARF